MGIENTKKLVRQVEQEMRELADVLDMPQLNPTLSQIVDRVRALKEDKELIEATRDEDVEDAHNKGRARSKRIAKMARTLQEQLRSKDEELASQKTRIDKLNGLTDLRKLLGK